MTDSLLLPPGPPERGIAAADIQERLCMLAVLLISLIGLVWISRYNYILFHSLAEMCSVVICWGVFFLAWSAHRLIRDSWLCVIGSGCLFAGFLYVLHLLAWPGMGVFAHGSANLAAQLWTAARCMHGFAFAAAALCLFYPRQSLRPIMLTGPIMLMLCLLFIVLIFSSRFPLCFIEGSGLTLFKKVSELTAAALFGLSGLIAWQRRDALDSRVLCLFLAAVLFAMLSGLRFVVCSRPDSTANLIGHCLNICFVWCLFHAFIRTGIITPQTLLFHELGRRQQELERSRVELEHQVRKRTQDLAQKNSELAESNQRLNEFAYSISHDLREPLRGMHNFAYILAEECSDRLDEDGLNLLGGIMRLARRLDAQVLAVLKYSRLGRLELEMQPADLDRLLDEVLDGLSGLITADTVRIERPAPLPRVLCHAEHVREVFHNLISNAVIYNDKPEKAITVGWLRPCARQPSGPPLAGAAVPVFYVRDNGIGIPEKHFQKIFDIFKRLHGQDKYGGGTGVGLTIVKQVVERHGGRIAVESEPGVGTAFYFTLSAG